MSGVTSPSMVDLQYLLGDVHQKVAASMGEVSVLQTCQHIGCCLGAFSKQQQQKNFFFY